MMMMMMMMMKMITMMMMFDIVTINKAEQDCQLWGVLTVTSQSQAW